MEQRCVQKLLETMTIAESMVKLGLRKYKLECSKSEENGIYEKDHKEDNDGNSNDDNDGNRKPQVEKKKPNRKMDKLKLFLCDGSYMLKKCLKKFVLSNKEMPKGKALRLGSSARVLKPIKSKCPKKSLIEGDDGTSKEPKMLGLSKGKVEAKRAKMSKKKRVKCFLFRGLYELRNCPK
ncbi:hypothetical protein J1N35_000142 [Gossypium stocksii]|uniref:Uncharacterized protein n=1 Tax=Gossypium stocksii TaxID=47602 RepID=A0A9D4AKK8_9ROSI|nr:hypothetical protein J1N35_000142 [Gossypium stocksii]